MIGLVFDVPLALWFVDPASYVFPIFSAVWRYWKPNLFVVVSYEQAQFLAPIYVDVNSFDKNVSDCVVFWAVSL